MPVGWDCRDSFKIASDGKQDCCILLKGAALECLHHAAILECNVINLAMIWSGILMVHAGVTVS